MRGERLPGTYTVYFREHEAHIAFMNDADGVAFRDWWFEHGTNRFWAWYDAHKDEYE